MKKNLMKYFHQAKVLLQFLEKVPQTDVLQRVAERSTGKKVWIVDSVARTNNRK